MDSLTLFSPKMRWTLFVNTATNSTHSETEHIWFTEKLSNGEPVITRRGAIKLSEPVVHEAKKRISAAEAVITFAKKTIRTKLRGGYSMANDGTGVLANLGLQEELDAKSGGISEKPMKMENGTDRPKHEFTKAFAMFKLDGMRCMIMIKDEFLDKFMTDVGIVEIIKRASTEHDFFPLAFRSYSGNVMTNNIHRLHTVSCLSIIRIASKILKYPESGVFLDGELYIHGMTLQQITGMVKKEDHREIELHLFASYVRDCSLSFWNASRVVNMAITFCRERSAITGLIKQVRTSDLRDVSGNAVLSEVFADFLVEAESKSPVSPLSANGVGEAAHEGIIVYSHDGLYEYGKRAHSCLKFKFKEDTEAPILNYERGDGKAKDHVYFNVSFNGHSVKIIAAGTVEQQNADLQVFLDHNGDEPLLYKFKYMGVTQDGVPRHAVGLGFRDRDEIE